MNIPDPDGLGGLQFIAEYRSDGSYLAVANPVPVPPSLVLLGGMCSILAVRKVVKKREN